MKAVVSISRLTKSSACFSKSRGDFAWTLVQAIECLVDKMIVSHSANIYVCTVANIPNRTLIGMWDSRPAQLQSRSRMPIEQQ